MLIVFFVVVLLSPGVCQQSTVSEDLLDQSLHCLLNLLQQCSENITQFMEAKGDSILKDIAANYGHNGKITQSIATLIQHLPAVCEQNM